MDLPTPSEIDLWDVDRLRLAPGMTGEVTDRGRLPRHRPGESFLRGPIPFHWVAGACRLPGSGLNVALVIRFLRCRFRRGRDGRWTLDAIARGLGVSDDSVRRGLGAAEEAELLSVARRPGCRIIVADVAISNPKDKAGGDRPPLLGPIPWSWLGPALRLPGSAARAGMACWLQADWERSARIEFAMGDWAELGLSRFSASRGLDSLVNAGLALCDGRPGRTAVVTIRTPRDKPGESADSPMSLTVEEHD